MNKKSKRETVFDKEIVPPLVKKLRENLKETNVSMRVSNQWDDLYNLEEQKIVLKFDKKINAGEITIKYVNEHLMVVRYYGSYQYSADAKILAEYVKGLANALKMKVVEVNADKFGGFIDLKDIKRSSMESVKERALFPVYFYSNTQNFSYWELISGTVDMTLAIFDAMQNELSKLQEEDITFQFKKFHYRNLILTVDYYYQGFEGTIKIYPSNPFTVEENNLDFNSTFSTIPELLEAVRHIIELSHEKIRLKNLIEPPNKHFIQYFNEHICQNPDLAKNAFNLLMEHIDPTEIEELAIKKEKKPLVFRHTAFYEYHLAEIFGCYIVTNRGTAELFEDSDTAAARFKDICEEQEYNRFKYSIRQLENVIDAARTKFENIKA